MFCLANYGFTAGFDKTSKKLDEAMGFWQQMETLSEKYGVEEISREQLSEELQHPLTQQEKKYLKRYNKYKKTETTRGDKSAMISFLAGSIGWLLAFIPVLGILSLFLWPVAITMGIVALRQYKKDDDKGKWFGFGVAGLVLGGIGILLVIAAVVAFASGGWF
jgi:hypothetical protein